ncbi:MAG: YtxH domain-containing protein [Actinobacteria bacterium]|nr:YtxH domain-containing protein [Actinomycetota bacterium]
MLLFHPFRTTLRHPIRTLTAAAAGAALAYFLDPDKGEDRRAQLQDQVKGQLDKAKERAQSSTGARAGSQGSSGSAGPSWSPSTPGATEAAHSAAGALGDDGGGDPLDLRGGVADTPIVAADAPSTSTT